MVRQGREILYLFLANDMVIFGEALLYQIQSIKGCLNTFEMISCQGINLQKSQVYFSNNVDKAKAEELASLSSIKPIEIMGSYLGLLAFPRFKGELKKRVSLDRVSSKVGGWKMKFLSFAGRQIMAQVVLNTIPYYTMQTTLLPLGVLEQIMHNIRTSLWGGLETKRR